MLYLPKLGWLFYGKCRYKYHTLSVLDRNIIPKNAGPPKMITNFSKVHDAEIIVEQVHQNK